MAYAAVISLKHTINDLLNSSRISLSFSSRKLLESAYNEATSLKQVLERLNNDSNIRSERNNERFDGLEGQIRDFAHKLEDVLEFHELDPHIHDEEVINEEITSFGEAVKMMEKDYIKEVSRKDDDDGHGAITPILSGNDYGVEMVGHSKLFTDTRRQILNRMRPDDLWFCAFWGEQGSGRTLIPKTIFEEARKATPKIYECLAWVSVGTRNDLKEVLIRIIAQVDNLVDYELLFSSYDNEELRKYLRALLEKQGYMVVLDDVNEVELVNDLISSFPDQSNGSALILTTGVKEVSRLADTVHILEYITNNLEERFLESTWPVMRAILLNYEPISVELEDAGKKIMHNCRCRLLSFAKTLMFLSKYEKTVEHWSKIAADKEHPIFMVVDETSEISRIKLEMQYCNKEVVGLVSMFIDSSPGLEHAKMKMHPKRFFSRMKIISVYGMAGIGKTTFARKIWKDQSVFNHFEHRVWINLGAHYESEEILIDILTQIHSNVQKLHLKCDDKLKKDLCAQLSCDRCLIVLDDLCGKEPLHYLKNLFPDIKGTILVTTRLPKVAKFERDDVVLEMQLLDKEESWSLLRQKVFGGGMCPPGLDKAGREIAEKCDGLPLLILTVADQLLKVEISEEYWNNVVSGKEKSIFKNAHYQISKALLPSYLSLLQHLKPCFLYMGIFREKYEIPMSDLTNLWICERFLEPDSYQAEEDYVAECLNILLDASLIMVQRIVSNSQIKTCRLHSVFWHLCNSQAVKNKFFHAMTGFDDCSIERIESQHKLCIRNIILLGMIYVQKSMECNRIARSLLCVGSFQQYPVPFVFNLRLLRVMNVVTIRVYEFPVEVARLVHLRYLGLTCNGKLPTSISNLWKLQYLIVHQYMQIISSKSSSMLPVEIWNMKELKHLQVMGGCLPNNKFGYGLLKLSTLLDVRAQSCRKRVLKWIPNLKRLGVRIELEPNDEGNSFRYLNRISRLHRLESLKCVVVNPQIGSEVLAPLAPLSMFPPGLKKLSLSGLGYPWEYMNVIGKLENLEVLKLKSYAFQGRKWESDYSSPFNKLKYLLVEDTNLEQWKLDWKVAINIVCLCIKHCYKLKELPVALSTVCLRKVQIVDCNPLTATWAEQFGQIKNACTVDVHNSWLANSHK